MEGGLARRPLLVKEEKGKGRWLVGGVEGEDAVEAATLLLKVVGFTGQPEPGVDNHRPGAGEVVDDERREARAEAIDHLTGDLGGTNGSQGWTVERAARRLRAVCASICARLFVNSFSKQNE